MAWSETTLHFYLSGLTKFLADSIAQNMVSHLLLDSDLTWKSFISKEETVEFVRKKHRQFKNGMIPSLDKCDTYLLASLLDEFLSDWSHDDAIKKIRDLRNHAAHQVPGSLSADDYKAKITSLQQEIGFFQSKYPGIDKFGNLKKILDNWKYFPGSLPRSNIHDISSIVGREQELDHLADSLQLSPLALITGTAGIGKSSLALTFAKEQTKQPLNICLLVLMKDFEINKEFGLRLENKISKSIGKCMSDIEKEIQNSDDAFSILKNYINSIPKETKVWLILDNIDNFDTLEARKALENVITRLSSSNGNIKFICTSRDWTLDPKGISKEIIALKPISRKEAAK